MHRAYIVMRKDVIHGISLAGSHWENVIGSIFDNVGLRLMQGRKKK